VADAPPLLTTLRAIVRALDALDAPYAVVGGIALMAWVPPRATTDVDVVVAVTDADAPHLARLLARKLDGVASAKPIRFKDGTSVQRILLPRPEGEVLLDLLLAAEGYLAQVLARRVRAPHLAGAVPVATAEDLLLMKLIAWRPKDIGDAHQLAAVKDLDWTYVRANARRLRVAGRLARVAPRSGTGRRPGRR
jgi:hypothetical protein